MLANTLSKYFFLLKSQKNLLKQTENEYFLKGYNLRKGWGFLQQTLELIGDERQVRIFIAIMD
jgi:hypothetical protein